MFLSLHFGIQKSHQLNEYKTYFASADGITSKNNSGYIISASGTQATANQYAITASGVEKISASFSENAVSKYVIYGSGYGHGIGMSQNGAKGMAKSGFMYDEILMHYFPGCLVENYSGEI